MIPFCFQDFVSISRSLFGILYQVDSLSLPLLFALVGIYPVPLSAGYSSVSSSCLYCCVWGGISVFWKFVEFCLLWSFLTVSRVWWVACQVSCWCSGGWSWISPLWHAMKCPVMSYEMSMGLEWLWAACKLKLRAMFLCCWRICVVCLALELVGPWMELGFSVGPGDPTSPFWRRSALGFLWKEWC